jgi:hypothetical protein
MKPRSRATLAAALFLAGATAALAQKTETRAFRGAFPVGEGTLRLANLAGRIELVRGQGDQVIVETTVHAAGRNADETRALLQAMKWEKGRDKKGREEWSLTYPVDEYRAFHYPRPDGDGQDDVPDFLAGLVGGGSSSTWYRGEKVRVYSRKHASAPTLWADLRIAMPARTDLAVKNMVGAVDGGNLEGKLLVDTGSGDVKIASFAGGLTVDTGSGDVKIGSVKGETSVDTGSGDVTLARLVGNGSVDTGSGDVRVERVSAGKLAIDTGSGDVTVRDGAAVKLVADTGSGGIEVIGVDVEELAADTGSGDVTVATSLAKARRVMIDTGSGDISIRGGEDASFDIASDQGSGDLVVGYADAVLRKDGKKVVGARRGDGHTEIRVATGSGDCSIQPHQQQQP